MSQNENAFSLHGQQLPQPNGPWLFTIVRCTHNGLFKNIWLNLGITSLPFVAMPTKSAVLSLAQ